MAWPPVASRPWHPLALEWLACSFLVWHDMTLERCAFTLLADIHQRRVERRRAGAMSPIMLVGSFIPPKSISSRRSTTSSPANRHPDSIVNLVGSSQPPTFSETRSCRSVPHMSTTRIGVRTDPPPVTRPPFTARRQHTAPPFRVSPRLPTYRFLAGFRFLGSN